MANTNVMRVVQEGPRNAVVELVGNLDTSAANLAVTPVIQLSDFTNNETNVVLSGFRLNEVQYSISADLAVQLFWNATADRLMVGLAGHDRICFDAAGGLQPVTGDAGYDGNINLLVSNIVVAAGTPIQTYTLLLFLIKVYDIQ